MASGTIKIGHNYLNNYEYYHNMLKGNPLFKEDDWTNAYNNNSLPELIAMMTDKSAPSLSTLESEYGYNFLDSERRQIALYNELYGDRTSIQNYKEKYTDENGVEQERSFDTTQYDYTKKLLQEARDYELAQLQLEKEQEAKEEMNVFAKAGMSALSVPTNIAGGIVNFAAGISNLTEGIFDAVSASLRGGNATESFRDAFRDTDFSDEYQEWLVDWERQYSYTRDINGNYTPIGKIIGGVSTSLGEMIPTMALSMVTAGLGGSGAVVPKAGQVLTHNTVSLSANVGNAARAIYYTGMGSNTFKEMSREMPTVPTMKLIINSAAKTAAEVLIENAMGKAFGASNMDKLHFNYAPTGANKFVTKNVLSEFAKDFIQEGSEELLQEFSGYIVDRFFTLFDQKFGDSTDWNFQTMLDAFIIGGLSTVATNAYSIITTKRVMLSDTSFDKDGNLRKTKDGINIPERLSKSKSWFYNKQWSEVFDMYKNIIEDTSMTLSQRNAALGQMYASYRTISSVYGEIGKERFDAATKMLSEMSKIEDISDRDIKSTATKLLSDISKLPLEYDESQRNAINKINATKINTVVNKKDDTSKIKDASENVKKTVNTLFKLNTNLKDVIITDDGTNAIEDTETNSVIVPKTFAETGDAITIYKAIAEETLQNMMLADTKFRPIINEFKKVYTEVYNVDNVTDEEVLLHALFDDTFYNILIHSVNKDAVQFLVNIENIVDSIQVKNGKDAIFKKTAADVFKNIKLHLINYCINQQNVIVDTIPVLDNKEKLYIKNKRYLIDTSNRVLKTDFGKKSEDDEVINLLKNKINNAVAPADVKEQLLKDINSTNSRTRAAALEELDEYYNNAFFGPYNDIIYKKEKWIGDIILNTFLVNSNLQLNTIYNENSYSDAVLNEMQLNSVSTDLFKRKLIFDYLNTKFKAFTNNKYTLEILNNNLEVKLSNEINMSEDVSMSVTNKLPNVKPLNIDIFNDVLKDIPVSLKQYISLNDLIVNGDKYLQLDKLKKYNSDLSDPLSIYKALSKYVETKTTGEYGLTITPNSEIILMKYEYDDKILVRNIDTKLVNLLNKFDKNIRFKMSDIYQDAYLTDFLSDVIIRVDGTNNESYGYYDNVNKEIVLNIKPVVDNLKRNLKGDDVNIKISNVRLNELKKTLLHEFHHAIADENHLSPGLGLMTLNKDVKADLFNHIEGLEQEISRQRRFELLTYDRKISDDTLLAKFLYDRINGELNAEGKILYSWPFVRNNDDSIITPWGSTYYIDNSGSLYMEKSKSNRLSYRMSEHNSKTDKMRSTKAKNRDRKGFKEPGKYDKSRYVAAKDAKGTLLEPYAGREISTNLRQLITSFDINKVDNGQKGKAGRKLYNLIRDGQLNKLEVFNVLRDSKRQEVDDYTFNLINDAYFKNPNIKNMDILVALSDRYIVELWALSKTLQRIDAVQGTNYKKYLTKKASVATMLDLIKQIQTDNTAREVYEYYLKRSQIVFDPTKKVEYSIEIDDANMRVITMHTFDGTINGAEHALEKGRFIASHNYKTPKAFKTISLSYETNEGDTTLEESLADKYAAEGYSFLIAERDKMESDMRVFYLERYHRENPKATQDDIKKFISEKQEMLEEASDEELLSLWRNSVMSEYAGEYATDKVLEYKYEGRHPAKIRANVNKLKNKILDVINHNTKPIKNKFIKSNSKYFEFDDKNNILFKEGILRVGKRPITLRTDQLVELEHDLSIIWTAINEGSYVRAKLNKEITSKIKELEYTVKEQKKIIKQQTKDIKNIKKEYIKLGTATFNIGVENNEHIVSMPDTLQRILSYSFTEFATSKVKFSSEDNMVISGKKFFEDNGELLSQLTSDEITDIINFYKYANFDETSADINTARKYEAFRLYLLGYFAEMHHKKGSGIVLTDEQMKDIKYIVEKSTKIYATNLPIATSVIRKIEPEKVLAARLSKIAGVEISEEEAANIIKKINETDFSNKYSVASLMKEFEFYYSLALKRSKRPDLFDRLWRFQRMAMLSSPGTWIRNIFSNYAVEIGTKLSEKFGDFITKNSKYAKPLEGQWQITGITPSENTLKYVKTVFEDSGLIDMLSVGAKQDTKSSKNKPTHEVLSSMIVSSLNSKLFNAQQFKNERLNKLSEFIYKKLDDDPWVKKAALRYFRNMLEQYVPARRIELTKKLSELNDKLSKLRKRIGDYDASVDYLDDVDGIYSDIRKTKKEISNTENELNTLLDTSHIDTNILNIFADAYTLAAYDYMHRPNMWSQIERSLHKRFGSGGFLIYKQILPFAGSSWNWFVESLKYTPMGLAKAIYQFTTLEKQIDKIKSKREDGEAIPSEAFTQYLVKRDLGKGVIGSIGFGIGILLCAFGLVGVDDNDEKVKIHIGDIYIDISDIFGSSSIFLGICVFDSIAKLSKGDNYKIQDLISNVLDQMFMDSTFSDLFNTFRYSDSVGEYIINNIDNSLSMFILNFIKTITSSLYVNKAHYNKGGFGVIERLLTSVVPFSSYILPSRYDPYTGEKQSKYKWPFVIDAFNRLSPVKISYYNVSETEKIAIRYGVRKGELTGNYEDVGQLNAVQVSQLNEYYGKLNSTSLEKLFENRQTYKVWNEDKNKYETLRFNKMNDEQKKNVIERIMNDNAKVAKAYVLTNDGYKYYTNENEMKYLRSLGISNIYKETKNKEGFIK